MKQKKQNLRKQEKNKQKEEEKQQEKQEKKEEKPADWICSDSHVLTSHSVSHFSSLLPLCSSFHFLSLSLALSALSLFLPPVGPLSLSSSASSSWMPPSRLLPSRMSLGCSRGLCFYGSV